MKQQIYYYNIQLSRKSGSIRSIPFESVFKSWIIANGGVSEFLKYIETLHPIELEMIHFSFLEFFMRRYNAILPVEEDVYFQEHLFNVDFYLLHIRQLKDNYENRVTSVGNIVFLVIVDLAIIGLVSLCS